MKQFKRGLVFFILISTLLLLFMVGLSACTKSEDSSSDSNSTRTEDGKSQDYQSTEKPEQGDGEKKIEKPERTLIFGENTDREADREADREKYKEEEGGPEAEVEIAEPSVAFQRNEAFLQRAGKAEFYPFDLVIGQLASYRKGESDISIIIQRAERFLHFALEAKFEELRELSSPSARDALETQVRKWPIEEIEVEEIRIGAIEVEDSRALFDFRIIAGTSRAAGSAVGVFQEDEWRIQALEFNGGELLTQYKAPDYSDFPDMYGFFQY